MLRSHFYKRSLLVASLALSACSSLPMVEVKAKSQNERVRYLVIHHTTLDFATSLRVLSEQSVSSHYLLPESGDASYGDKELTIYRLVDETKRAWHAGASRWNGDENLNDQSIGIELVYRSPCKGGASEDPIHDGLNMEASQHKICFYPDFDPKQISLLTQLTREILLRYPGIDPTHVVGHSDIAPNRKVDPGPRFPWQQLAKNGIGAWYDEETVARYFKLLNQENTTAALLQNVLQAYGYGYAKVDDPAIVESPSLTNTITTFQMHFRSWHVNGEPDAETLATALALVEKYRPEKLKNVLTKMALNSDLTPIQPSPTVTELP